ncbi:LysR family transcriptional regulator [Enemella evansiae]|uniref:LysR family transcriptional regulator n=1 Tax=Enemella evansiae TaxID=2016499 RepID=UPI000B9742A2|nr:LysR family transcriptional regulator [Enemella evansiae]OYO03797.1 LysR family transcriptional regulator [Enemella evansiae]OYO10396.1 LysR family transcriptional regulator [Enemella evansiae]
MELQQLRYVLAVAEERSFTRAAERCFVVQSALSHQIKALETELGVRLFARTSRRVQLTAAGEAFLPAAREALSATDRAAAEAAAAEGEIRGALRIGVIPTVTAIDIPAAIGAFHRAHPAVRVGLRGGASDEFIAAIAAGRLDVAVLGLADSAPPTGVRTRVLARERLVAVVSAAHPLAGRRRVRLTELAEETFADFPAGSPGRTQSELAFTAAGITRQVAFEVSGTELMLELVRQQLGVAMLPPAVVPADPALRTLPVTGAPTRIEYLAWSDFNPSPAAAAFVELALRRS